MASGPPAEVNFSLVARARSHKWGDMRPEKVEAVEDIKQGLRGSGAVLLTEYRGLKVKELQALRRDLARAGARYRVLKNSLVRFAARDLDFPDLEAYLTGPTAIAFCESDPVAPAKVISEFARTNPNLVFKASLLQGRVLDAEATKALAALESREVLLARAVGAVSSPLAKAVGVMQALIRQTAVVVGAYLADRDAKEKESN